ncbi:hypothetical protein BG842_00575 [Haladaptatus sp. W1]|uniref:PAS domain-containing protein n=1 Tax=Haladaptatus sp. W1 TaxID=1897478 RepID=UPI000849CEE4|nr:PAS domain-containing protein [Haladaptatus sp. W1]ODR80931.1 hypothetical protein BG842_00575 [Haladaptatus sp. W1]
MKSGSLTDSLRETLAIFDESKEPWTTPEVAESLGLGRRSTYARLERLAEQNRIETKKVGANARVWWQPPANTDKAAPDWSGAAESLIDDVLGDVEVGIFVLDENFDIAWINGATERYFGLDRKQVVGRDKRQLIDEHIAWAIEDSEVFTETVLATYDDNTYTEHFECHVMAGDEHEERWLEHRSKPIESGEYAGGRVELYYDVTDRKQSAKARREDHEQLKSLVGAVEEYAIFTLDTQGYVQTWNPGAEQIMGYETDEVLGNHFSKFYPDDDSRVGIPKQNLNAAAERGSIQDEGWRIREDGSRFWAKVTITAIHDEDGDLQGYAKVTHDITERHEYERKLRRERDLTERLLETAPISVSIFRANGSLERINSRARQQLGISEPMASEFDIGDYDIYDADGNSISTPNHPVSQVIKTEEEVSDWLVQHDGPNDDRRWVSLRAAPLFDNDEDLDRIVVAGKDVTDPKQKEQQLEHQRTKLRSELNEVFDRINDAVCGLDTDWRFTYINDHAEELMEKTEKELLGTYAWDAFSSDLYSSFRDHYERAMETQNPVTFEEYADAAEAWLEVTAYPSESGLSIYFRDITKRKERERALEESEQRYRTLVENFPNGAVTFLNHDLQHTIVGGQGFNKLDFNANDLQDKRMQEVYSEDVLELIEPNYRAALNGTANSFEVEIQGRTFKFRTVPLTTDDDDVFAAMVMSQDVTERRQYQERLQALYTSSRGFLTADTIPEISRILVETASDVLDLPGVVFYDYDAEHDRLIPDATSREADFMREEFPEVPADDNSITGCVFSGGDIRYYENVLKSPNLQMPPDATEMRAGLFVPLGTEGILVAGSRDVDGFDANTRRLVKLLATNAETAYERVGSKQELIHQNEQLTALNSLNEVIQEIMDAAINQSTREEIEATVCEHLADSDSYLFAWVGDVDAATQTVNMRAKAGVEGDLDGITISVDPDDDQSKGPIGRAFRTGEIQTTQDFDSDSRYDPWRDEIESYGFQSSVAIPIIHENAVYGVLSVYAERPFAFDGHEGEVIAQLGEIIGHTIAAAERKQALLSDEIVELEFQLQDVFADLGIPAEMEGTITLDNAVPVGDDEFLVYGTATSDAIDTVTSLVETLPHWEAVTVHSEGTPTSFELKLTEPPILSVVASIGGNIEEVIIDDGDYQMTIHLAPSVDVHQVIDAVEKEYPQAEMVRRRQITRSHDDSQRILRHLVSDLTDRQHATLDAAYHAGFFEWPRETSGEDVAESMGVAPPTFHQHLRKAERKVFDIVFSSSTHSTG